MKSPLADLQRTLDYQFNDESLLQTALTHRSKSSTNYERLEFLGDAILGFIVAEALFSHYKKSSEGHLSRYRARLVRKETLADLAKDFSLGDYLFLGSGELKSGGFRRESILADAMEAVFGAMYLDGGLEPVRALIDRVLLSRMDSLLSETELKDPKTRLQEHLQARGQPLPEYSVITTTGDEHNQSFTIHCVVKGVDHPFVGLGRSRRKAEQAAAKAALDFLLSQHG